MVLKDRIARSFIDGDGPTVVLIVFLIVGIAIAVHPFIPIVVSLVERLSVDSKTTIAVDRKTAISEFYKLAVTAIIGGLIGLLIRSWEQQRQLRAAEHALLQDFHQRYVTAYNTAKKARRMLRAKSTKEGARWSIDLASYDEIMSNHEDAQLQFEALRRTAQAKRPVLGSRYDEIAKQLKRSEEYLRDVVDEYENEHRKSNQVMLDGETLCFFIRREDATVHNIEGREKVDNELFHPMDSMEQHLIELMLRRTSMPKGKSPRAPVEN